MGSGKQARRRGHDWERAAASDLGNALDSNCKRSFENRAGGTNDVEGAEPLVVQCKAGARPSPYKALEEAAESAEGDHIPVGAVKFNADSRRDPANGRKAWRGAVIRWSDFLELLEAIDLDEL